GLVERLNGVEPFIRWACGPFAMGRERVDGRYTYAVHVSTPFTWPLGRRCGVAPHRAMRRAGRDWPTGERTQMSAISSWSVSPRRHGELTPQNERAYTARDEDAVQGNARERWIAPPRQAVFTKGHVGVGQARLQLLHDRPLCRRGVWRLQAGDLQFGRQDNDVGTGERLEMRLQ